MKNQSPGAQGAIKNKANKLPTLCAANVIELLLRRALPHLSQEEKQWLAAVDDVAAMHAGHAAELAEHLGCMALADDTGNALGDPASVSSALQTLAHVAFVSSALRDVAATASQSLLAEKGGV